MNLKAEQITENFDQILQIIDHVFSGERKEKLTKMFTELGERFMLAPASSITYFHNAFPGGLCLHTLNVVRLAKKYYELWKEEGADMSTYSFETLIFCAIVHDIGKVGDEELDFYIPNDSDWHIKRGQIYKLNPSLPNMRHSDRTLYLLQKYGISISQLELITIMIHDGPSVDSNKFYFDNFDEGKILKSNLPYILHIADFSAYRIEHEEYLNKPKVTIVKKKDAEKIETFGKLDIEKTFESLFPDKEVK